MIVGQICRRIRYLSLCSHVFPSNCRVYSTLHLGSCEACLSLGVALYPDCPQVEDKFTPYGKETLAKLIDFLQVCSFAVTCNNFQNVAPE